MPNKRYPGVSPFTEDQQSLFFGREKDIKRLYDLISLRSQVLLYSKSGVGKTSLLNAGVLPKFEDEYVVIKVRFFAYNKDNSSQDLIESITHQLRATTSYDKEIFLDKLIGNDETQKTLWYYFKKFELLAEGDQKFILVFDQFEELFSYPVKQITSFKKQLYEVLKMDIPDSVMQLVAQSDNDEKTDELFGTLDIKTVFAIRSDRLSLLNHLTDKFPDIQETFYELKSLKRDHAKRAIISPAESDGKFESKSFEFEDTAIDKILDSLSNHGTTRIESTQLQIVCSRIETDVLKLQKNRVSRKKVVVTADQLPQFQDIFRDFYKTSVAKTEQPEKAIRFIEDHLIRKGQRISLDKRICLDHVTEETLATLTNTHLLRGERNTTGGRNYELSHDSLITPILTERKIRVDREERDHQQKTALETLEKERKERKEELKKRNKWVVIFSLIGIALVVLSITSIRQKRIAQDQKQKTKVLLIKSQQDEQEALNAKREADSLKTANLYRTNKFIQYLKKDADNEYENNNFEEAIVSYERILNLDSTIIFDSIREVINLKIDSCKSQLSQNDNFDSQIKIAQNFISAYNFIRAKKTISDLEKMRYSPGNQRLDNLKSHYKSEVKKHIHELLNYAKQDLKFDATRKLAKTSLDEVLLLDPGNAEAKSLLKKYKL